MPDGRKLRLIGGAVAASIDGPGLDADALQARCIEGFLASRVARGFSPVTIEGEAGVLERFLGLTDKPAWELTAADVDDIVGRLVGRGVGAVTRRGYVGIFKQFFGYLEARHAGEIEARFGVRLVDPIDHLHAGRHVGSDSPATRPPPTPARMDAFFGSLRERMASARKWTPIARDYALFRTLYHAGLRAAEASALEVRDVHFERGPFGKLHVRFGKAARGSGPRPRWVPMLDDLALILHWYLDTVRPRFRTRSEALFPDEGGDRLDPGSIRNRLAHLVTLEGGPAQERFSPHDLRHACATRNYERGVDLVAIQQMLGHWTVGTTMRYVTPSSTFVEDAYRRALSDTLATLTEEQR